MKKRSLFYIAFFACVTLATSCLRDNDAEPIPAAGLTMINAYIESDAVLYEMDGRPVPPEFYPLAYRTPGFVNLFVGNSRRLEIYTVGDQIQLVDTTFAVQDSVYYSSFIFGTAETPLHFITEDRVPEDASDPATFTGVRFFNLANTPHEVTLRIGDTDPVLEFQDRPTETPQSGKNAEAFIAAPTGTYQLSVADEDGEILFTREEELQEGRYMSIFLTGDESVADSYYIGILRHAVN